VIVGIDASNIRQGGGITHLVEILRAVRSGSLRELIDSPAPRAGRAQAAFDRAQAYSWVRCADETFEFLVSASAANHTTTQHM
jgi:hypothetical protein